MAAAAYSAAPAIRSELQQLKSSSSPRKESRPAPPQLNLKPVGPLQESEKILLQPRMCTLRSYGSGRDGVLQTRRDADVSPFLASLSDYIENSRKSQHFETISGRLAMIAFAGAVAEETITGNSLFRKMDLPAIAEAAGVCVGAILFAAAFAWFSSNRTRVGKIFTVNCNSFVDSLIDNIIDGLFYESEFTDWSDDK
ncbi:stress enhanced protein 2, chloroplastic [Aristolochia californica]|uniref:stress enhanced protein 2, chloroplastic n=1 Tax=Aristolochia californica TaxID=171875 RepID=UPI0035D6BDB8